MAKKDKTEEAPETTEVAAAEEAAEDPQDSGAAETAVATEEPGQENGSGSGGRRSRKVRVGVVTSDKQDKTVTVQVERMMAHPLYGKRMSRTKKYHAHDENNEYQVGDKVRIGETRPLSKTKRWRVIELIERSE